MRAATQSAVLDQVLTVNFIEPPDLRSWADAFLNAKKAESASANTLATYGKCLAPFLEWCALRSVNTITDVTAEQLRAYLLHLEETGHNAGGRHIYYRTIKTFCLWWARETDTANWHNPFKKVRPPKLEKDVPLDPADIGHIERMVKAAAGRLQDRDRAILITLLDTGLRANELCALDLADLDSYNGKIIVRHGKGNKSRVVFLGQRGRRVMRVYLKVRGGGDGPLFVGDEGQRLKYSGLRQVVRRAAASAGVPAPSLHSFRRAFALAMLRNGADLLTLQRLMGHADLSLLHRYAKQNTDDLKAAHDAASPADRGLR